MLLRTVAGTGLILLVVGALPACEETKRQAPTPASSASADEGPKPGVDPHIAKAVESAAAKADGGGGPADGPPPNGVFGPGDADKAHAKDAPRKLELFGQGSEPRVTLRAGAAAAFPKKLRLTVAQRVGPQAMPTLEYILGVKVHKPKAADEGEPAAAGPPRVVLSVKDVQLAKTQPGAVPRDLDKEVARLKDSDIVAELAPDGALSRLQLKPAKAADAGLHPALEALMGAVETAWLPTPDKPVGVGAYWMVIDRVRPAGLEVVRYRVCRLTTLAGKVATLTMDVRQYSIGGLVSFPGAPPGLVLTALGFKSSGKGNVVMAAGSPVPRLVELGLPVQMQMEAKQRPGQAMVLQAEMAFRLASPETEPAGEDAGEPADETPGKPKAPAKPKAPVKPAVPDEPY